jgi:hypothetical protein
MPKFNFVCPECAKRKATIGTLKLRDAKFTCECGAEMKRDRSPPSTQVLEHLDNGIMTRAVERLPDIERIMHERSHKPEDRGHVEIAGKGVEEPEP